MAEKLPIVDASAQLSERSHRALERALPTDRFIVRREGVPDYGVDATIGLVDGGRATNARGLVQLKSTGTP